MKIVHANVGLLAGVALAVAAGGASAQAYPVKPIRLVSEYVAGAGGDVFFRPLAAQLTAATGQQWVIENRAGAGGLLAIEAVMTGTSTTCSNSSPGCGPAGW